jgi:type III pantothenate kinase
MLYGYPALVIDFGTATSFDVVSAEGNYEGGVIVPGVKTSLSALVESTAKLPRIELAWPKKVVGKNTVSAMQSGAVIGYACLVDGLIEKLIEEAGPFAHIISTGGIGKLFSEHCPQISAHDSYLTLKGLQWIAELHNLG